jgi:hypothetical protein
MTTSYDKRFVALRYYLYGKGYFLGMKAFNYGQKYHTGLRKGGAPEYSHQVDVALYLATLKDVAVSAQRKNYNGQAKED